MMSETDYGLIYSKMDFYNLLSYMIQMRLATLVKNLIYLKLIQMNSNFLSFKKGLNSGSMLDPHCYDY